MSEEENDMSMTDEHWETRITKVQNWMETYSDLIEDDEDLSDSVDLLNMNIKRGNKRPNMRKKYWGSMLLEGRTLPHWPIQKGKESTLPQHVQTSLKEMATQIEELYTQFWNDNPLIQQITVVSDRNKTLGGSPHDNAEEFAKGRVLAARQRFTKYFTNNRWNGEFDLEEGFNITPPPATENEEEEVDSNE